MLRIRIVLLFNLLILSFLQVKAQLPEGFAQVRLAEGLDPTSMTSAPDGRIFITEKNGRIRIVRDGVLLPDPFLTIPVDNYNERGLGSIALHPDFERNHFVYVFYTVAGGNRNRISRFTANGDYAIPGSEQVILEMDPLSGTIHNGGSMGFGPDGKLYIATGDGSLPENSQRLNNLLGKVLRINDDGSIPADNPYFSQTTGNNRAIWALGFRNPFSIAIQPGTGRLFANDVGSQYWEEVNDVVRGGNYGWARLEGFRAGQQAPENYQDPLHAYDHNTGCSIIGAAFYNPAQPVFPARYHGKFFFADYCQGFIRVLNPATGQVEETFLTGADRPVGLLVTPNGDFYYLARAGMGGGSEADNTSSTEGSLWRVFYTGSGAPVISTQPATITLPVGETATFRVSATGRAPLSFQWERNEQPIPGANQAEFIYPDVQLSDDGAVFQCRVGNASGQALSGRAILRVTPNTRPLPEIVFPTSSLTYAAGDTLFFSGRASDAEDGNLTAERLSWRIDFHHADHTHPAMETTEGIDGGRFVIPRIGEIDDNVWYRIYLTATDAQGLSRTVHTDVFPRKTEFVVISEPPGLEVNVDGRLLNTPQRVTSVVGIRRTLSANPVQVRGEKLYRFLRWSDNWTEDFFPFLAGDRDTIRIWYEEEELAIGKGKGLLGEYYQGNAQSGFNTEAVFFRIDPVVNFDWGGAQPDAGLMPDNFLVRWRGEVLAPLDGTYTFHAITDDGVRLWVNEQLLINQWVPQAATETTGQIALEGGKRYPVVMEYYEAGGLAVARLLWSTEYLPRQIIPRTQLYPGPRLDFPETARLNLYPSPAQNWLRVEITAKDFDRLDVFLYDVAGRQVYRNSRVEVKRGLNMLDIDTTHLAPGVYIVKITGMLAIREMGKFVKQ